MSSSSSLGLNLPAGLPRPRVITAPSPSKTGALPADSAGGATQGLGGLSSSQSGSGSGSSSGSGDILFTDVPPPSAIAETQLIPEPSSESTSPNPEPTADIPTPESNPPALGLISPNAGQTASAAASNPAPAPSQQAPHRATPATAPTTFDPLGYGTLL